VTNSLAALSRGLVYCTEPYRISFAGKLDVLCFDKTGTLTKDEMILRGVVAPQDISLLFAASTASGNSSSSRTKPGGDSPGDDEQFDLDAMPVLLMEPDAAHIEVFEATSSFDAVAAIMGTCHDLVPRNNAMGSSGLLASSHGDAMGIYLPHRLCLSR
jgi:magnesium-transporting ATPase (P-type)